MAGRKDDRQTGGGSGTPVSVSGTPSGVIRATAGMDDHHADQGTPKTPLQGPGHRPPRSEPVLERAFHPPACFGPDPLCYR
ncbi:hypothetical protein SUDANB105_07702 [Streptomyces sp. enrichment culture]